MSEIRIGDLSATINAIINEYGEQIRNTLDEVIPAVAKDTAKQIQRNAKREGLTNSGDYAKGWKVNVSKNLYGDTTATVYQKTKPGLPHLLEFGHATRNGGRTKPAEHIAPAEKWAEAEVVKRVKEAIE